MTLQGTIHNGVVVLAGGEALPDGTPVTVFVHPGQPVLSGGLDVRMSEEEHRRLMDAMDRIASLPLETPNGTFSGADHDRVLYGEP